MRSTANRFVMLYFASAVKSDKDWYRHFTRSWRWFNISDAYTYVNKVFTARCTLVHSAVLRSHVVCLSVCLSVTLVNCDHIGWNSSKIIASLVSLGCSLIATPTWRVCSKGNTPKFGPKVTHPPVERRRHSIANCGRMVTDSATVTMESL